MKILSIDIGVLHLSMVGIEVHEMYKIIHPLKIYMCELINLLELMDECDQQLCTLYHDRNMCDYMDHMFKRYRNEFDDADIILVERQPITGLTAVQELILREYRSKVTLISPNSVHKFLQFSSYTYDQRKEASIKFAVPYLSHFKEFCFNERRHDMADAFCMIYYHLKHVK